MRFNNIKGGLKNAILCIFLLAVMLRFCYADTGFNVQTVICAPAWYCTYYSQSGCGLRSCIDVNACGINDGKPSEIVPCPPPSGGSGNMPQIISNYPQGYFTISSDLLNLDLVEGQMTKSIITIRSFDDDNITMNILYPQGTADFIKAEPSKLSVSKNDVSQVSIYFDTLNMTPGTYVLPIQISGLHYTKNMTAIININPLVRPNMDFDILLDSRLEFIGIDNYLNFSIGFDKQRYSKYFNLHAFNITTTITDSFGSIIYDKTDNLNDLEENQSIALQGELKEGYYVIATTITDGKTSVTKNKIMTLLSESKYHITFEKPETIQYDLSLSDKIIILIGIISIIILIVNIYSGYKRNRNKSQGPDIIKIKVHKSAVPENKNIDATDKRSILLKKSLDQGFITLNEYNILSANNKIVSAEHELKEDKEIEDHKNIYNANPEDNQHDSPKQEKQEDDKKYEAKPMHPKPEMSVSADKAFFVINGKALHSIKELEDALAGMPPEIFYYHVTNEKNDFANWIRDIFDEKKLAHEMRRATTPEEMRDIISKSKDK